MTEPRLKLVCPFCGTVTDAHTCFTDTDARPAPGDISVCFRCHETHVLTEQMDLRKPTPEERADLEGSVLYQKVKAVLLEQVKQTGGIQ